MIKSIPFFLAAAGASFSDEAFEYVTASSVIIEERDFYISGVVAVIVTGVEVTAEEVLGINL